ncbi:7 transmembrane receptor (rhodopsin) [Mactra antiquata]
MDKNPDYTVPVTTERFTNELIISTISDTDSVNISSSMNNTNGSTIVPELDRFYFYQTEEVTFLAVLLVCIVVGNSIVLLAIGLSRRRHSRMHFFIMHLALADLSVGLVHVLGDMIWKITVKWYAGDVMCRLLKFAQACVVYASTYMLVALSIDRYDAIARPLNFSTTWTRCKVYVGVAWGLSALFSSPLIFLSSVTDGSYECWMKFPDSAPDSIWLIYFVSVMTAVLILPALIITACYTMIIVIIWKNSHLLSSAKPKQVYTAEKKFLVPPKDTNQDISPSPKSSPKQTRQRSQNIGRSSKGIIPQAKIRTVKMTFTIVLAFIICWSPYFIFNVCSLLGHVPHTQEMLAMTTFVQSLAPLNSAANPLIYGIFSTRVCRYLRQLKVFRVISKIFCCQDGRTPRGSGISDYSNVTDTDFYRRTPRITDDYTLKSRSTLDISTDDYRRRSRCVSDFTDSSTGARKSPRRLECNNSVSTRPSSMVGDEVEMCDLILMTKTDNNRI